jgi:hypothetical protein
MKDICKGCSLDILINVQCSFISANEEDICPCTECLVKAMCKIPCEKRTIIKLQMFKLPALAGVYEEKLR